MSKFNIDASKRSSTESSSTYASTEFGLHSKQNKYLYQLAEYVSNTNICQNLNKLNLSHAKGPTIQFGIIGSSQAQERPKSGRAGVFLANTNFFFSLSAFWKICASLY